MKSRTRLDEINAEGRADAAIRSITCLPIDEWKERGRKLRDERLRMEGKGK